MQRTTWWGKALVAVCAFAFVTFAGAPSRTTRKKGEANRVKTAAAPLAVDSLAVNNPATRDDVGPDAKGASVVRAQILLDRAHFSPGEIDGHYGDNLRIAVTGYQQARKLPVTGVVDSPTWDSLNSDQAPPLVDYIITLADAAGPYDKVPPKILEQAKVKSLGYSSAAEAIGERFHIDPKLLAMLNPGKELTQAGQTIFVPNVQRPYGTVTADRVVASKSQRTVQALAGDGSVLAQYPATMGSQHDPLPIGDWEVTVILQNPVFHYNPTLFWNAPAKDSKADVQPGPNNPVGVVWIGLSKEHYGIHGTPQPAAIGHAESHGCVRLTNWDAEELSRMLSRGTPVVFEE